MKKLIVWTENDDNNNGYPVMQTESGFFWLLVWGYEQMGSGEEITYNGD
jgi:hypothetical protein